MNTEKIEGWNEHNASKNSDAMNTRCCELMEAL